MKFKLLRLLAVTLHTEIKEWHNWNDPISGVSMWAATDLVYNDKLKQSIIVLVAEKTITSVFDLNGNRSIIIPNDIRRELEILLETYANLAAVANRCKRSLSSPYPYIAIEPIDDEAKKWIEEAKNIEVSTRAAIPVRMAHDFDFAKSIPYLQDRLDGVALIAESLCHDHSTGRLHELMRLFERAFATAATKVCRDLLPQFLSTVDQGFTKEEIDLWLELRDTSSHADRRPSFATEVDTRPAANRMEQAAYDILFNKIVWHNPSLERRSIFRPICGSLSGHCGGVFVIQKTAPKIEFQLLDGFNAYPWNFNLSPQTISETWFTKLSSEKRKEKDDANI